MKNNLTYCSFCPHHTRSGCNAKPNSSYCIPAKNEFYAWLAERKRKYGNK